MAYFNSTKLLHADTYTFGCPLFLMLHSEVGCESVHTTHELVPTSGKF